MSSFDLVVASHLRWSFVWQRPQQLLSHLARYHRILFVEERNNCTKDRQAIQASRHKLASVLVQRVIKQVHQRLFQLQRFDAEKLEVER